MEDKVVLHKLYRDVIQSGIAFGAERWLTVLQRMCERFVCLMVSGSSSRDLGGGNFHFHFHFLLILIPSPIN